MRQDALSRWTCFFANFVYNRKYTICTRSRIHCFHNSQLPILRLREKNVATFSKLTEFKTVGRRRLSTYSPSPCTLTYTMHELWHTEILYAETVLSCLEYSSNHTLVCRDSGYLISCLEYSSNHVWPETNNFTLSCNVNTVASRSNSYHWSCQNFIVKFLYSPNPQSEELHDFTDLH